jgi:hypothetical protein
MSMNSLRVLALAAMPLMFACATTPTDNGPTGGKSGSGGAKGTGGSTGSNSGTGGSSSSAGTGGSGSSGNPDASAQAGSACGNVRSTPSGEVIDNFDGQKQALQWLVADMMNTKGTEVMPTGKLTVPVTGPETLALGALAMWAAADRPCMDGSQYTGIQFTVSGNVNKLLFRIGTPATYPTEDGGTCTSATMCGYAHYQKDVTASVASGGTVKVAFADMAAPWGSPAKFEASNLISVIFLTLDTDTTHSFTIDDVAFYK